MDHLQKSAAKELSKMLKEVPKRKSFVFEVDFILRASGSSEIMVFPKSSRDRKLLHLLMQVHRGKSKTLEKP